ncbi:hypothetical protein PPYR_00876 [Photinus pyralis]|uniref:Uncharacterized protein n=1 Tax=Photinus pyralis TaxID=7054 RepID=A0A5N4B2W2_PHOPY|nr:uncharacterized protein LOC116172642 [Photinus pyralis]KAB0803906.1 hypothetical protein PPYR_00876 [Photinus pyralis]
MAQYDLYNSPSFLPLKGDSGSSSSSISGLDSYNLYKDMQKIPNVPLPNSNHKRKQLFTRLSPNMRSNKLHEYLMQLKRPVVASTPRGAEACSTSGVSFCGLSPIVARRDSIIHINGHKSQNIRNDNCSVKVVTKHLKSLKNNKLKKKKVKRVPKIAQKQNNKTIEVVSFENCPAGKQPLSNIEAGVGMPIHNEERETQTSNSLICQQMRNGKSQSDIVNPINLLKDKLIGSTNVLKNSLNEGKQSPQSSFKNDNSISKILSNIDFLLCSQASRTSAGSDKVQNNVDTFKHPQKDLKTISDKKTDDDLPHDTVQEKEVSKISEEKTESVLENRSTVSKIPTSDRILRNRSKTANIPVASTEKKPRTKKKGKGEVSDNKVANLDSEMKVSENQHHTLEGSQMGTRLASRLLSDCSSLEHHDKTKTDGEPSHSTTLTGIPEKLSETLLKDGSNISTNSAKRKRGAGRRNNTGTVKVGGEHPDSTKMGCERLSLTAIPEKLSEMPVNDGKSISNNSMKRKRGAGPQNNASMVNVGGGLPANTKTDCASTAIPEKLSEKQVNDTNTVNVNPDNQDETQAGCDEAGIILDNEPSPMSLDSEILSETLVNETNLPANQSNSNTLVDDHLMDCYISGVECIELSSNIDMDQRSRELNEADIVRETHGGSIRNFEISRRDRENTLRCHKETSLERTEEDPRVAQRENTIIQVSDLADNNYSVAMSDREEICEVNDMEKDTHNCDIAIDENANRSLPPLIRGEKSDVAVIVEKAALVVEGIICEASDLEKDRIGAAPVTDVEVNRSLPSRVMPETAKDLIDNGAPNKHDREGVELVQEQHVQSSPTVSKAQIVTVTNTTQPSEPEHNTNDAASFVVPTKETNAPSKSNRKPNTQRKANPKKAHEDTPIKNNPKQTSRDTKRKTTKEHIVLKQYIRTRKSGFVRLEETAPSCSKDSTMNDTGRPRRAGGAPRAFIQATFVDTRHIRKLSSASVISTDSDSKNTTTKTTKTSTTRTKRQRTTKTKNTRDSTDNDQQNENNPKNRREETAPPTKRKRQVTKTNVSHDRNRTDATHSVDQDISAGLATTGNCESGTGAHNLHQGHTSDHYNTPVCMNETGVAMLDSSVDNTIVPRECNAEAVVDPKVITIQNTPIPSTSKANSNKGESGEGSSGGFKMNTAGEEKDNHNRPATGSNRCSDHMIQAIINNKCTPLEWCADPPQLDPSQNLSMMFCLTNLKSHMCTTFCGFIQYGPGRKKSGIPKNHALLYKVEKGNVEVTQQFNTRILDVNACFYIPLGSPYTIKI